MRSYFFVSAAVAAFSATSAIAGGAVAPIVDVQPVSAPAMAAPAPAWAGGYVGGNLNFGKGKLQAKGELADLIRETEEEEGISLGRTLAEPDGASAAIRAGYDWQIGRGVFGLGGEYNLANYKSGLSGAYGDVVDFLGADAEVRIKNTATVFARAGYLVNDNLLAYGLVGYTRAKGEASGSFEGESASESTTLSGTTFGVGAEYLVNANWSAYAEYAYTDFGDLRDSEGNAEVDLSQVKLGVNYRF